MLLLIGGVLFDDLNEINTVSTESLYALIYLIVFGSLLAYICFLYALTNLPAGLVSIYAYVNPFIALILGFLVLGETITWITGLAPTAVLSGVWSINKGYSVQAKQISH